MNLKIVLYISLITAIATTTYLVVQFVLANLWILFLILAPFVTTGLWFLYNFALTAREKRLTIQAERKQKEIVIHTDGYGMTHLIDIVRAHSQNLTLDARAYRNGHFEEPHPIEQRNLELILGSRFAGSAKAVIQQQAQLPPPQKLDFYRVMMQPGQVYAIIAGQQVGKTHTAITIANEWIQRGFKPLVVGPKWDIGEWPGCELIGGKEDFTAVSAGLERVRQIAKDRHESDRGHKEHRYQPIFLDDWTLVRAKCDNASDMILEASTFYASVNLLLYFIIHTDTAHAWGVGKEGAALKNNFVKLFLQPQYNNYGEVVRTRTRSYIVFPAQTTEREIELPGASIAPDLVLRPNEPPAGTDADLVAMAQAGMSYKDITMAAWGQYGKFYNDKLDRILAKYGARMS